jgi:hypothetical protein
MSSHIHDPTDLPPGGRMDGPYELYEEEKNVLLLHGIESRILGHPTCEFWVRVDK